MTDQLGVLRFAHETQKGAPKIPEDPGSESMKAKLGHLSSALENISGKNISEQAPSRSTNEQSSTIQKVKDSWREIARLSARCCFDSDGKLNLDQVKSLKEFWQNLNCQEYGNIPGIELIKDQNYTVLSHLCPDQGSSINSSFLDILNEDSPKTLNRNSSLLLGKMTPDIDPSKFTQSEVPQNLIALAILQSLFTPHRQMCLPTCSINALINAEIFNHPERLAKIYLDILSTSGSEISLPSESQLQLKSIHKSSDIPNILTISVKCRNQTSNSVIYGFKLGDKLSNQGNNTQNEYEKHGITVTAPPGEKDNPEFNLEIPVYDLNDVFFANFMNQIYSETDQSGAFIKARELYFRVPGDNFGDSPLIFNAEHDPNKENHYDDFFSTSTISKLIQLAQTKKELREARLITIFSAPEQISRDQNTSKWNGLHPYLGHVENIDLQYLSKLTEKELKDAPPNKVWKIGDRNWTDDSGFPVYLGIAKEENNKFITCGLRMKNGKLELSSGVAQHFGIAIYQQNQKKPLSDTSTELDKL